MFNKDTVKSDLSTFIKFRGWHNTDVPALNAGNLASSTDYIYNTNDGIVNLLNINACKPKDKDFNTYLDELKGDVIEEAIKMLFDMRKLHRHTKELLKDNYLFNGPGRIADKVSTNGRFVGYRIEPTLQQGMKVEIDEIWTQFDTVQSDFDLHLFHSSRLDPIKTIRLNRTRINEVERHKLTGADFIEMFYVNDNYGPGGYFYLGYFESALTGQAISRNKDLTIDCCGTSFVGQRRRMFDRVTPMYVTSNNLNGGQMWDNINDVLISNNSFGLNLRLSVKCDLTEYIIRNKEALVGLLKAVMKKNVLSLYFNSNQVNHIEGLSKEKVAYLVNQMEEKKEIENKAKEVHFEFENRSPCLPYVKRNQVRHGSL